MSLSAPSEYDPCPPSKASLLKWWKAFTRNSPSPKAGASKNRGVVPPAPYQPPTRGLSGADGAGRVFGVGLEQSLKYASVAISMVGPDGKAYVYGYVPIVVAKCGMMLKETATQTEGIFRVSGSNKRINQLQAVFDSPPRYGKTLDWSGYSVHDAASVLRRYLNMMPDPVIPQNLYMDFTAVLQKFQPLTNSIAEYRQLIALLPPTSRYLLLYLLDFLSVFSRSSASNLMTASNLAVVFQPGLVSTRREGASDGALLGFPGFPGGQMPVGGAAAHGAGEHGKAKEVLEFLIEQQAHFVLGLEPPIPEAKKKERKGMEGESGYGMPGGSVGPSAREASGSGATELSRKGSEKSVERRRLRKSGDGGNAKVKRSKTLPGSRGSDAGTVSTPNTPQDDSSPSSTRLTPSGSVRRKPKTHFDPAPTASAPQTIPIPNSSHLSPPDPNPASKDTKMGSPNSHSSGERDRGWSPPWKARKSFEQQ